MHVHALHSVQLHHDEQNMVEADATRSSLTTEVLQ